MRIVAGRALECSIGFQIAAALQQSDRLKSDQGLWIGFESIRRYVSWHAMTLSAHSDLTFCRPAAVNLPAGFFKIICFRCCNMFCTGTVTFFAMHSTHKIVNSSSDDVSRGHVARYTTMHILAPKYFSEVFDLLLRSVMIVPRS